ncbi:hypothetical protein [Actinacidiphila rubida]|uniref:Uncharacterized protein n=1 Tax=Actinacidiphila rubida TaxID=310780 RepID=A0A1H8SWX9_9ACTN|nr:hypothetical protein [Actinacidiphila rubida]SEO83181.1 hypothetical protein SAMN05216267_104630 [Actinacidiphila rubida]
MTHRIKKDQEYESCQPTYYGSTGPEYTRIRVIEPPRHEAGRVGIATVHEDGRLLRRRIINARQLHATGTVGAEQLPRRTGYRLVTDEGSSEQ